MEKLTAIWCDEFIKEIATSLEKNYELPYYLAKMSIVAILPECGRYNIVNLLTISKDYDMPQKAHKAICEFMSDNNLIEFIILGD